MKMRDEWRALSTEDRRNVLVVAMIWSVPSFLIGVAVGMLMMAVLR